MKRFCSVILMTVLLLLPLGSCASGPDLGGGESGTEQSGEKNESISVLLPYWHTTIDYNSGLSRQFGMASAMFAANYGIKVERYIVPGYENMSDWDIFQDLTLFLEKLSTEIMVGNGPDVFLCLPYSGPRDLEKKMKSGAFYDLNEFIENDPEFDLGEYEEVILSEGIFDGKRYYMPLSYNAATLVTSKEKLALGGFTPEDFSAYERFISAWEEIQSGGSMRLMNSTWEWATPLRLCGWLDECVDFESGTANFSLPSFERMTNLYISEWVIDNQAEPREEFKFYKDRLFWMNEYSVFFDTDAPKSTPVEIDDIEIFPIPNADGSNTAQIERFCMISSAAKNPENAWLFLKTLLSDEVQGTEDFFYYSVPVKSAHVDKAIEHQIEFAKQQRNLGAEHYDDAYIDRIKEIYHSCDNAVLSSYNAFLLFKLSGVENEYIDFSMETAVQKDFETFKEEMDDYFRIYLSE